VKEFAPAVQASPQRAVRDAEPAGRGLLRLAFETAENQRLAVARRQSGNLLIEERKKFARCHLVQDADCFRTASVLRGGVASCFRLSLERQPGCHRVEPAGDRVAPLDEAGLSGQNQEGGLEDVFGVLLVSQRPLASSPHHRAVPRDQGGEGRLVMPVHIEAQQLAVGRLAGRVGGGEAPYVGDQPGRGRGHVRDSEGTECCSISSCRFESPGVHTFSEMQWFYAEEKDVETG
jgi:hypothetical protein